MIRLIAVALLVCCSAFSQEFEVASIKPAPPPDGRPIRIGANGGPGSGDPTRLSVQFVTVRQLLMRAYDVKTFQISGPASIDSDRYNLTAKVPEGATKEQVAVMLQNLLAERFKLTIHRETKELPAYALLVGKNGPKLTHSPEGAAPQLPPPPGEGPVLIPKRELGKDGFPQMPANRAPMMMMRMPGRMKMSMVDQTMTAFCDMLANQLNRPVIDLTELPGKYDFTLAFSTEGLGDRGPMGGPMPPGGGVGVIAGGGGFGGGEGHFDSADAEPAPSLQTAVQEQLGLRLDARKSQQETIVVDHVEKTPTDN
jgi:uncharacterized protein (TIGR03435 family)